MRGKFERTSVVHVGERLFRSEGADEQISLLLAEGYKTKVGDRKFIQKYVATIDDLAKTLHSAYGELAPGSSSLSSREYGLGLVAGCEALRPLGDVASVQIGEVVGATKFFVRTLADWQEIGISEKHLKPLLTRSGQCAGLALNRQAVDAGIVPYLLLPGTSTDAQVESLLSTFAVADRDRNSTFRKRAVWHTCSYHTDFDAVIPSLNHVFARIISNDVHASCGNGLYKIQASERSVTPWLPLIALTTPFRLTVELHGRPRGGGALKLEPSDVRRLLVPIRVPKPDRVFKRALCKCAEKVQRSDIESATEIADEIVYVKSGLLDEVQLGSLRGVLQILLQKRLPQRRRE